MNNRFVTEKEVEAAKKKREEEWAKARAAGREIPAEEPKDCRSLYERLKEQKDKKQEEFEEQLKFKNQIYKGLNDEDASFLSMISKRQAEIDGKRFDNEEIKQYKAALDKVEISSCNATESKKVKLSDDYKKKSRSQAELMSMLVRKRKSSSDAETQDGVQKKALVEEKVEEKTKCCDPVRKNEEQKLSLSAIAQYSSSSDEQED